MMTSKEIEALNVPASTVQSYAPCLLIDKDGQLSSAPLPPQSDHDAALAAAHAAKVERKKARALQAEQTRAPRERG
jgi:hypothetical protein